MFDSEGISLKPSILNGLSDSINDNSPVSGLTHNFYKYPARFSPTFARKAIELFTRPGEVVYDPFMGGGTTLVEAMCSNRQAIGTDLNSLAVFISKVKTSILYDDEIEVLNDWYSQAQDKLKLNTVVSSFGFWKSQGYLKNISSSNTWPIRNCLQLALNSLEELPSKRLKNFIRCSLLRTAQWALDCKKKHPTAEEFRVQLGSFIKNMIMGIFALRERLGGSSKRDSQLDYYQPKCLLLPADRISTSIFGHTEKPRLILTSPPYPGVHVLYHRWQIHGRRETPAPYWIADCLDGNGAAYYTFGGRRQKDFEAYFQNLRDSYSAIANISNKNTWLIQLVGFNEPQWQLPKFMDILSECGFEDQQQVHNNLVLKARKWRYAPNRKFYAEMKGRLPSAREFLLIHKLR